MYVIYSMVVSNYGVWFAGTHSFANNHDLRGATPLLLGHISYSRAEVGATKFNYHAIYASLRLILWMQQFDDMFGLSTLESYFPDYIPGDNVTCTH